LINTGPPSSPLLKLSEDWITETADTDVYNVTLQWDLPGSFENFISQYVVTVAPELPPCGGGLCLVTPGDEGICTEGVDADSGSWPDLQCYNP